MSRLATILLLLLAVGAGVFLFVIEPRWESTRDRLATREFVFNLDAGAVRELRVVAGENAYELTRRDDGWHVGPKPGDVASPEQVGKLLAALSGLRVHDVIGAAELREGRDRDDFGLAKPRNRLEITGDEKLTLEFGKEAAGEGRIYVRRGDSNDVFVVDDVLQQLAFRNAQDFRDRRLSGLTPDRVDAFRIKRDGGEIAFERGAQGWLIVRPLRARADDHRVDKLLAEILRLPILEFVADESNDLGAYGAAQPRAEITMQVEGESRPIALRLGGPPAPGKPDVLGQFTARDSVYRLPARAWELLQTPPDALRDRRLLALNLDTIDAIRVRNGDASRVIERTDDAWREGKRPITAAAVEKFARATANTRTERYLALTAENLRAAGLDAPAGEIAFDAWLSENTPEATAGRRPVATITLGRREGANVFVRVNDEPEIALVPAAALDAAP